MAPKSEEIKILQNPVNKDKYHSLCKEEQFYMHLAEVNNLNAILFALKFQDEVSYKMANV